jgi:hypothetical protein
VRWRIAAAFNNDERARKYLNEAIRSNPKAATEKDVELAQLIWNRNWPRPYLRGVKPCNSRAMLAK